MGAAVHEEEEEEEEEGISVIHVSGHFDHTCIILVSYRDFYLIPCRARHELFLDRECAFLML